MCILNKPFGLLGSVMGWIVCAELDSTCLQGKFSVEEARKKIYLVDSKVRTFISFSGTEAFCKICQYTSQDVFLLCKWANSLAFFIFTFN